MVAQSLIVADGDVAAFRKDFARRLQTWFATLPAGIGLATAKACLKLWLFIPPQSSGIFSAGNGPAMRAAIVGAYFRDHQELQQFLHTSTTVTHTDPKAYHGALAVALAANLSGQHHSVEGQHFIDCYTSLTKDDHDDLLPLLQRVVDSVQHGHSVIHFADQIGCKKGVSGYVLQTVPMAIHAWLSHQRDYEGAVSSIIECGGDADTTAAIVGGIVGTSVGLAGIPADWRHNVIEWPRTISWITQLGQQLADRSTPTKKKKPPRLSLVAALIRNLAFLVVVLFHGFRRLLPPF